MPEIRIQRQHALGLPAARKLALKWAEKAEAKFDLECTYEEGDTQDTLHFSRAGIEGTLDVRPDTLDFRAQLGFLFSAFKSRIETELAEHLDQLLAAKPAAPRKRKGPAAAPGPAPAPRRAK